MPAEEVVALQKLLQDIVFRGHFVSGYPERVDWLRERGLDSAPVCKSLWCRCERKIHQTLSPSCNYMSMHPNVDE